MLSSGVPPALWLVESFLNSVDVESGQDDLDALPRFRRWLRDHGRGIAADTASEADLLLARELRDELRAELCAHHDGGQQDRSGLDRLAAAIRLTVRFEPDGSVRLSPADRGVPGVLGEVLAAIAQATHEGTWARLKICSADSCRYVYYDRSKNASRRWCSMDVCGNRQKTRAYRSRQRAQA
jgi:predicted RNA-binding Zn ribbon-like protein